MKQIVDIPDLEKRYRIDEDGAIFNIRRGRYLKPFYNTAGYLYISVEMNDRRYVIAVHRIVAVKYIGQPPKGKETSHKDGSKQNNHYTNLEYLTHSENILRSYAEHGRKVAEFPRLPFSDATKELMSNAKKKQVQAIANNITTIYGSIDEITSALGTYRKKIYLAIRDNKPINGILLSFVA